MTETTYQLAVMQFKSEICCCGDRKVPRQSFCTRCYLSLPQQMRKPLIGTYGERFELAYFAAVDWLTYQRASKCIGPRNKNSKETRENDENV